MTNNLKELYGNIDIYLFDQLLKGRFNNCQTILDAGCGGGRNLHYFLHNGVKVYGVDADAGAVAAIKQLSAQLAPDNPTDNFTVSGLKNLPYTNNFFDLIICSAVLHFAKDHNHFDDMLRSIWRVLKPGGFFFARLASDIGIEKLVEPLGNGRYNLPDGSTRYLVNEEILIDYTTELGGELFEPIKTTNVQNLRCMTTWCIIKK
jgi:tellurite methyltransferase